MLKNKIIKIWHKNSNRTGLSKYPRFWIIMDISDDNKYLYLINATSQNNWWSKSIKSNCSMLSKETKAIPNTDMEISVAKSNAENYIFNDCSCKNGCIEKHSFQYLYEKYKLLKYAGKMDYEVKIKVEELYLLSEWSYSDVQNSKTGKPFKSKEEFLKSNNMIKELKTNIKEEVVKDPDEDIDFGM